MRWLERIFFAAWLVFCLTILAAGTVWGGDCTSPDDCRSVPDNGSRTAAVGGGLLGGGLAWRSRQKRKQKEKRKDQHPCHDQQRAYNQAQGLYENHRQLYHDLVNKRVDLTMYMAPLRAKVAALWPNAVKEMTTWTQRHLFGPPKQDPTDYSLDELRQLGQRAAERGWPDVQAFVQAEEEYLNMQKQLNDMESQLRKLEDDLKSDERNLADAKQLLDECLASQGRSAAA